MTSLILRRRSLVAISLTGVWLWACCVQAAWSSAPADDPDGMPWNVAALSKAPSMTWVSRQGPVHALTYEGEAYQGHPTRVFAYYASPVTVGDQPAAKKELPGIVLVHGGGGRAFSEWAELWARRGYAAIAMDLAGCGADGKRWPDGGPDQSDRTKFLAIDAAVTDQWTYHAVADVLLAHSLLLSFPEVDPDRTAVTGISWGGYLTCIVAGVDSRFKFAMPVYGCGFLHENSAWLRQFERMTPEQAARWVKLWDPSQYIGKATMPIAFLNGTNDFAYPMDSYAKTCRLVPGQKNYSIQLKMRHGHIFDFPEFFVFMDQYLKQGTPMPVVTRPNVVDGELRAQVTSPTKIVAARLHYTTGAHADNKNRPWTTQPLQVKEGTITGAAPPDDATVWYVDVTDERKLVVSSEVMISPAD